MINDNDVIETLDELETFLRLVENGGLGLENVEGSPWLQITVMVAHLSLFLMIIINYYWVSMLVMTYTRMVKIWCDMA